MSEKSSPYRGSTVHFLFRACTKTFFAKTYCQLHMQEDSAASPGCAMVATLPTWWTTAQGGGGGHGQSPTLCKWHPGQVETDRGLARAQKNAGNPVQFRFNMSDVVLRPPRQATYSYHPIRSFLPFAAFSSFQAKGTNLASLTLETTLSSRTSLMHSSMAWGERPMKPRELYRPTTPTRPPSLAWPLRGRRPAVGLREQIPLKAAGMRTLPPTSEPTETNESVKTT